MTQLLEFKNQEGKTLRGLLDKASGKHGIVFVHGFERSSTEMRFKNIIDQMKGEASFLRFDFSGCGISDGSFQDATLQKQVQELHAAIKALRKHCPSLQKISLVAHSFGCCVALQYAAIHSIEKLVLFGPAFHQKVLLPYWFVCSDQKLKEITWNNYKRFLNQKKFLSAFKQSKRITRQHIIGVDYFLENHTKDYQDLFPQLKTSYKNILIIHGDADEKVPLQSNHRIPRAIKIIKVRGGDHDLERPDRVKQYFPRLIRFLQFNRR